MKDSKPSLILYIFASILVIVGKVFGQEILMLVGKPMVVPAIYYYYLQTKTKNTNLLFTINIWLFFIADMIMLIYGASEILWVMGLGILSYLILIRFALKDCGRVKFNWFNVVFVTLLLTLLGYILYSILNLDIVNDDTVYWMYGSVLIALIAISVFNYLSNSTTSFLHLSLMALCMLVSDLFYAINKFVIELVILDHINLFSQFLSYFFMVRYFNSRRPENLKRTNSELA